MRAYRMDHGQYAWSPIVTREPLTWPKGARIAVAFVVSLGVLTLLVDAGVAKLPAQALAIIAVTPLNFVGNKLWSFRGRR